MAITKTIEIDVVAPNAQQNINSVTTSLNNASKSSDNLNKTLNTDKGAGKFTGLKNSISELSPTFKMVSEGASAFNKQLLALLANPIGLTIAGIVLAVTGLVAIFRTFQPVVDKIEQALSALSAVATTIKNTFIAVTTGTKSLGDAFSSLGSDISDTASRTMDLVKAQQDLEDVLAQQEVQTSRTRAEINKLNVQAKNRALSEAERLKLLEKASKLEEQDFKQRVKNVDEEVRIAREAIAIKAGFNKAEIKLLKEQGLAVKELAESKGGNFDEEFKALANAQKNRIALEDESTANLEKNQNKRDALEDAQKAKRDQQIEKEKADREKATIAENKRLADLAEAQKKEKEDFLAFQVIVSNAGIEQNILQKQLADESLQIQSDLITKEEAIRQQAEDKEREEAKKTAEQKKILREQEIELTSQTFGKIADLADKNSKIGKAFAVGQALINTYQGITAELQTKTVTPFEIGLKIANVATIAGIGFKAVKSILSTNPMAGGGSGTAPTSGGSSATSTPQFNMVGQSSTNQLAQTISSQQNRPIRTYVVSGDVTTQQSLDRNAVSTSTFGG